MALITIINDPYELGSEEGTLIVENISDYVDACMKIVASLHEEQPLKVFVRNRTAYLWLSRLESQYAHIDVSENSPRELLERKWGLNTLPSDVTDRDIFDSGLLDMDISLRWDNWQDIILDNFFSQHMASPQIPVGRIVALVQDLLECGARDTKKQKLIEKEYFRRLDEWKAKVHTKEEKDLLELLQDSPQELLNDLMCYKLVQNYPIEVGKRVLGNEIETFRRLSLNLADLRVIESESKQAIEQIEVYLNQKDKVSTPDDLDAMLHMFSGELMVEFGAAVESLEGLGEIVNEDTVKKVKHKFNPIEDRIRNDLVELDMLISPPKPRKPGKNWDVENWIEWAIDEYLPYQFWLEERNEYDEETAGFARAFGDWYFSNFISIRTNFDHMLHKAISNICDRIREKDEITLLVMIDNFNFKYFDRLRECFAKKGYFGKEPEAYLALLPTETGVCKRSLFSGEPEIADIANKKYDNIINDAWRILADNKQFMYCQSLGGMNSVSSVEDDVYLLNYCEIDKLLHESEDSIGKPHRTEVPHKLEILVDGIENFAKRLNIENKLSIIVCSDHGSTKIQGFVNNSIDRQYYKSESENEAHRYVTLSDKQVTNLPSHVEEDCYVMNRKSYGLPDNILIAKGYGRFKKTSSKHYVHGGISPEEVIVPFATFKRIYAEPEEPRIRLSRQEFRYSVKSDILIELTNVNDYELSSVEIDVRNSNIDVDISTIAKVKPKSHETIELTGRFAKTSDIQEQNNLFLRVSYQFLGRNFDVDKKIPIKMKSMVEQKTDMDDLF